MGEEGEKERAGERVRAIRLPRRKGVESTRSSSVVLYMKDGIAS